MKHYLVIFKSFLTIAFTFTLMGCENDRNTQSICNNNPELCSDLHKDSWCRFERGHLIRHRLLLKNNDSPTDQQVYNHLLYLEQYSQCIELASGVQHIIHKERTNDRMRAFGISTQNLQQLQQQTKNSTSPLLAYYNWSRFNDLNALDIVLKAEEENRITDTELLAYIAGYYLKINQPKAQQLYIKAISLAGSDHFNADWLLGLADVYRLQQDFDRTYMLTKANLIFSKNNVSNTQMLALIQNNEQLASFLDDKADDLADAIDDDDFAGSQIEAYLASPVK